MRITAAVKVTVGTSLVVALAGACSEETPVEAGAVGVPTSVVPAHQQQYEGVGIVVESPEHGPVWCFDGPRGSRPPQCDGAAVLGWGWDKVEGESSMSGTTWKTVHLVGTWDGEALTLTEVSDAPETVDLMERFATPCAEPAGGWENPDPAFATDAGQASVNALVPSLPGYAGHWVDPREGAAPVLSVYTTGDVAAMEARVREAWNGPLCIAPAQHSLAELERINAELDAPGLISAYVEVSRNRVRALLPVPDEGLEADLDAIYGPGAVHVEGWLQPVD
jgi:hypothetical protein